MSPLVLILTLMNTTSVPKTLPQQHLLLTIAAVIGFAYSSGALAANCKFTAGFSQSTVNFASTPINLTVAKDAPIGTVVYQESVVGPQKGFICYSDSPFILFLNPTLGSVATGTVFPLGKTGLSLKIYYQDYGYLSADRILVGREYLDPARDYTIEIIKSSEQPSQNVVPAGYLGTHRYGDVDLVKFNLINPITLNAASCQTPDVSVQMGDDYQLHEFRNVGDIPRIIKFNIGLNQCQTGIQKVTYSLTATSQVIDQKNGIVALNSSSTAKGIGLKLMDDAGQPIALGTTYSFNGFNTTGTNFKIPLSAAYYRLADKLEAGTANASVTFTMDYL